MMDYATLFGCSLFLFFYQHSVVVFIYYLMINLEVQKSQRGIDNDKKLGGIHEKKITRDFRFE